MGWHYGFKLHLVIDNFGYILAFTLSPGNVDDRAAVPGEFIEKLSAIIPPQSPIWSNGVGYLRQTHLAAKK